MEPYWKPSHWDKNRQIRICIVNGLCNGVYQFNSKGQYPDDGSVELDASIAELVELVNKKGFKTWASCSGLDEDHTAPSEGYLSFRFISDEQWHEISAIAKQAGFPLVEDRNIALYCYGICLTNKEKQGVWLKFYELVKKL